MIEGNWGDVLVGREFEGAKEGLRREEGNVGDVRSFGEMPRKACGVPGRLRPVTVSFADSTRVGRISFDGVGWSLLSKLYRSTTRREDSIGRAYERTLR